MKKPLSQEHLKLIACLSMMLDHIGAVLLPWPWLRAVGRLAFPIYCFLLCEGIKHTHNARRYLTRLVAVALLSEIPFDLLFYGELTAERQNVMFTLILGFLSVKTVKTVEKSWVKVLIVASTVLLAELLGADYGGEGVLLILSMAMARDMISWAVMMVVIFLVVGGVQIFGLLTLIPIWLYSGERTGSGRRAFYLFYPAHMVALLLLDKL